MKIRILLALLLMSCPAMLVKFCRASEPSSAATLQKIIDTAYNSGSKKVTIQPGTYRCEGKLPWTRAWLNFSNMHDFEIDATGVTLVDSVANTCLMRFENCINLTVRGVTLDHDPPPFSQGAIEAIENGGKSIRVRVATGYPTNLDDKEAFPKTFPMSAFDRKTRLLKRDHSADMGAAAVQRLGPDLFKFQLGGPLPRESTVKAGDLIAWRGYVIPDFGMINCASFNVVNVTVHNGSGCCIFERDGEGGSHYESCCVARGHRPPNAKEDPLFASNADGFDSTSIRHGPTLEKCNFEFMDDDGIAMASYYGLVAEAKDKETVIVDCRALSIRAGDAIHLLDDQGATAGEAKAITVSPATNYHATAPVPRNLYNFKDPGRAKYYQLTFDRKVSAKAGWLICDSDTISSGFIIRECTIKHNRARGLMLKASNGLIEGCTLEGNGMSGIAIAPEIDRWNNSDYSHDVVIRNNHLIDTNVWHMNGGASLAVVASYNNKPVPLPGGHRNITIENNTFDNNDGINLIVTSSEGIKIQGNTFTHPDLNLFPTPAVIGGIPNDVLCYLTECKGISLSENTVVAPGRYLRQLVETAGTVKGKGIHDGIKVLTK